MSQEFKDACSLKRQQIEQLKGSTLELKDMVIECGPDALAEARKNIEIAFRHLEDARMRFGKAIQAASGGVSIYDRALSPEEVKNMYEAPVVANEKGVESDADLDIGSDNQ